MQMQSIRECPEHLLMMKGFLIGFRRIHQRPLIPPTPMSPSDNLSILGTLTEREESEEKLQDFLSPIASHQMPHPPNTYNFSCVTYPAPLHTTSRVETQFECHVGPLLPLNCQLGQLLQSNLPLPFLSLSHFHENSSSFKPFLDKIVLLFAVEFEDVTCFKGPHREHKCEHKKGASWTTFSRFWRRFFTCRAGASPQCLSLRFHCFADSLSLSASI